MFGNTVATQQGTLTQAHAAELLSAPLDLVPALDLDRPGNAGSRWTSLAELIDNPDEIMEARLKAVESARGASRDVAASLLLGSITRAITGPAVYLRFTSNQVPHLRPEHVLLAWGPLGQCSALTHLGALPTTPSSEEADPVDLVQEIGPLVEPLVAAVRSRARVGQRLLWSAVATAVTAGFVVAGRSLNDEQRARQMAEEFTKQAGPAWKVRPDWFVVTYRDIEHLFLRRKVCCLAYKLPNTSYCTSCPLLPDEDRRLALLGQIAAKHFDDESVETDHSSSDHSDIDRPDSDRGKGQNLSVITDLRSSPHECACNCAASS